MTMIDVRRYLHASLEYELALELRRRVLRAPLGLTFSADDLAREAKDIHIGAFAGEALVGTLLLSPHGKATRMRQVAVDPSRQGEGIGHRMVEFAEMTAKDEGFVEMTLHAREGAVGFYLKLGYVVVGEPFIEVTIPHSAMRKVLA